MSITPNAPRSLGSTHAWPVGGQPTRRDLLGAAAIASALASPALARAGRRTAVSPAMVGSANALAGMKVAWPMLLEGCDPLDAAIATVKVQEADPEDTSVGYGGLPNEAGVVQLDAACMHGPTHHSGAVACIENIKHPSEVARLVMERTDHCLLVGKGAYEFARAHGFPHEELLTEKARQIWLRWKEGLSDQDDWLPPGPLQREGEQHGSAAPRGGAEVAEVRVPSRWDRHGTVHCSALS